MGRELIPLISIVIMFVSWSIKVQFSDAATSPDPANSTVSSTIGTSSASVPVKASGPTTPNTTSSASFAKPNHAALLLLNFVAGSILRTA